MAALDSEKQADVALAFQKRGKMTWEQIILASRHGLGSELLPKNQIKLGIPSDLEGLDAFMVLRYSGKLPMIGFRTTDTFHVVWIEAEFGTVYSH